MKVLFYGGKSHGRHSMNVIAEMLKRGHDVFVLKIDSKSNAVETKVELKSFRGTNEKLVIDARTVKIESLLPGSREIWVCNLREKQKFQEITIGWAPDIDGLLLQLLIFRAGKLFYEDQILDDTFLKDRNFLESEKKILNLIELLGLEASKNAILEFAIGHSNTLKLSESMPPQLLVSGNSIDALRIASKLLRIDSKIEALFKDLGVESVYTTRNCFGDLFEESLTRTANDLKLKTFYEVFSWDNLTTKCSILTEPDTYFVWNQTQLLELRSFHNAKASICVTGASRFENLFHSAQLSSAISNPDFSILYIGSSPLGCPNDFEIFKRLHNFLSNSISSPLSLVYRVHKDLERIWGGRSGSSPDKFDHFRIQSSDSDFLSALSLADLVIAVNTSAVFEVATQGKSVYCPNFLMDQSQIKHNYHGDYMSQLIMPLDTENDCLDVINQLLRNKPKKTESFTRILDFISPHGARKRPSEIALNWMEDFEQDAHNVLSSDF